ncbi:Gag polyprotein [Cricetulus griseus]|uniref:Gag polyprotein n=1 Tax=Cricetulus griseus TaxID=10029 RepID=A0A061IIN2_CRIGR|nr:Gag polyprotein [Cricetulus griseus]
MFSHQRTCDDGQQLLQTFFTTEERERILLKARKNVPGADGTPSRLGNVINAGFPLDRPNWDFNMAEGRERLTVYCQTLVAGLRGAARHPTNLAKEGQRWLTEAQQANCNPDPPSQDTDQEAKRAAQGLNILTITDPDPKTDQIDKFFDYTAEDLAQMKEQGFTQNTADPEWRTPEGIYTLSVFLLSGDEFSCYDKNKTLPFPL